jgi:uncharacterized Zn finger protein
MPDELSKALHKAAVAGLASAPYYERGVGYLEAGRVGPLRASAGRIGATVQGSEDYLVELRVKGGKLRFSCSCPVGREGAFCKHCVAVALAWQREHDAAPTLDDARAHLETLPQGELVDILIDHAHDDEALARKLLLRTATPASAKADVASLRALIEQAFAHRDFVPYREVWGYVRGIEEATDVLEAQLEQGATGPGVARRAPLRLGPRRRLGRARPGRHPLRRGTRGRRPRALPRAGRGGVGGGAEDPDPRLRAFLIEEYRRRGRSAEALEHSVHAFDARPTLESYRKLATDAKALGEWEERRRSAISLLGRSEPHSPGAVRHPSLRGRGSASTAATSRT